MHFDGVAILKNAIIYAWVVGVMFYVASYLK